METDGNESAARLLDVTLEIIHLLTGEDYTVTKKTSVPITDPPPHSLIHARSNKKKILELAHKMMELLTGEDWARIGGPKDQGKDVTMEDQQPQGTSQVKVIPTPTTKSQKRSPENDAKYHIRTSTDKPGLTARYINDFKGRGVFALAPMEKGDFVVEFRGELIDVAERQRRLRIHQDSQKVFMYEFQSGGQLWCIDAVKEDGSLGRLVNDDGRNPNCKIKRIRVDGKPHLCLFAIRDINPGEEITYNYGGSNWPWREKVEEEPAPTATSSKVGGGESSTKPDPSPPNTARPSPTSETAQAPKGAAPPAVQCKVEQEDGSYRSDPNTQRPSSTQVTGGVVPTIVRCKEEKMDWSYGDGPPPERQSQGTQAGADDDHLLETDEIFAKIIDSSDEDGGLSEEDSSSDSEEEAPPKKDDPEMVELRSRLRKLAKDSGLLQQKCFQNDPEWPTVEDIPVSSNYNHPRIGNIAWCACGMCLPMGTRDESVCCREEGALRTFFDAGLSCITQHRELNEFRLQEKILEMNAIFSGKVKAKELTTERHRVIRKAGYRSFSVFAHGVLGPKRGKPIPSCVVNLIRGRFPDADRKDVACHWNKDYDAAAMALEV